MRKTVLRRECTIEGRSAFALPAKVTLKPTDKEGIFIQFPGDAPLPLSHVDLSHSRFWHCLILRHGSSKIWVPEHLLGFLYIMGASNVIIQLHEGKGIPYDSCADQFFTETAIKWQYAGEFSEMETSQSEIQLGSGERFIRFTPDYKATRKLTFEIKVKYEGVGEHILQGSLDDEAGEKLFSSIPFGRGHVWKLMSSIFRIFGWRGDFVNFDKCDDYTVCQIKLEEIARHRLIDLCGALACASERPLSGHVISHMVGHVADVGLVDILRSRSAMIR